MSLDDSTAPVIWDDPIRRLTDEQWDLLLAMLPTGLACTVWVSKEDIANMLDAGGDYREP